jgi:hypothetical protein
MLKMKYPTRIYYTEADKAQMWDRWPATVPWLQGGSNCVGTRIRTKKLFGAGMGACRIWRQPADCIYPRRPFRYEPDAFKIDRYLNRLLLELVKEIRIE